MRSVPLILVVAYCVSLSLLVTACKPVSQTPQQQSVSVTETAPPLENTCVLRAGFDAWEPYHYLGQGQQAVGMDIDILQALAAELNCDLQLEQDTWTALLTKLRDGELDLLPGASRNIERENYAWFSEPYRQEQFVLYTRNDANLEFADIPTLLAAGNRIGLVSDYYYGEEIDSLYGSTPQAFVSAQIAELNLARLLDEDITAALEDSYVATAILRRKGLDRDIVASSLRLPASDVHLMLSKTSISEAQLAELNAAINRLKQNGSLAQLLQQYQQ
ncbi:periplasmic solute-binding protein [Alishewanella longhuensis]|uniref:Periplasmic solute-binding protein n=1 Tax=Alishewanella longhuensis TaxID=1091037 RepID=A0ABQ3L0L3_9ALTE|nr:transporter substrate-binding domain-containing protein [Alishewanella longhuensis]GHG72178.1 periplasmic solute-binding protein [Alishewanella longhuensis]